MQIVKSIELLRNTELIVDRRISYLGEYQVCYNKLDIGEGKVWIQKSGYGLRRLWTFGK